MISVGIMTAIMAATMSALSQAMKANETAVLVTGMNNSLRTGMDLMMRDLLQVGSGLPPGALHPDPLRGRRADQHARAARNGVS